MAEKFVFVSFKVLASANVSKHRGQLYGHVPNQMLDWRTRRKKLIFELELCSPDIICLQVLESTLIKQESE
jgi:mRNA deadenylase 3'-5' endonuclease subunit Ccr4